MQVTKASLPCPVDAAAVPSRPVRRPCPTATALAALALSTCCFIVDVGATSTEQHDVQTRVQRSVEACVQVVRLQSPTGRFTAYVVDDRVRANGSSEEALHFQRCMEARGKELRRHATDPSR